MDGLKRTALYDKHKALNAKNIGFCGWDMPVQYEGIIKEHEACRNAAALFDTSHMGEFFFEGELVDSGMDMATTIDVVALPVGKCKYGFLLNRQGGVIDDLIIYKLGDKKLMFVVNASRIDIDYSTITNRLSGGKLEDRSKEISKLDIQGPKSKEMLQELVSINLNGLGYFEFVETKVMGIDAIVSRTGYTGELGYELYLDNSVAPEVWDQLVARGATPAGLGARDVLRLEMGYSLYGQELDENTTPIEAGVGFFVKYNRDFVGRDALLKQKENGAAKRSISFSTNSKRAPRHGMDIYQNSEKIGVVTSGTFSPFLGTGIGIGSVEIAKYDTASELEIRGQRGGMSVYLTELPFITKEKKS